MAVPEVPVPGPGGPAGPDTTAAGAGTGPRALVVLGGTAAAVVVAAGIHAASWLVGPVFLALVIVITIHPVRRRLVGTGLPAWAATAVMVVLVLVAVTGLAGVAVVAVAQLATVLPLYAAEVNALVTDGMAALGQFGVGPEQLRLLAASLNVATLLGLASGMLLGLTTLLADVAFLLALLLFLCLESSAASARLALLADGRRPVGQALRSFAGGTRRFLAVTTVIGLLTGVIDTVVLALLGVPAAALWGLLVFLTNYIPYVGFWIGLGPPALLGLLVGGWPLLIAVVAVFVVVNFVLTSLVQPYYVGDAVGISVTVALVSLMLWGWLLGPVGAVLAVPLTLLVKAVLVDADPRAVWADGLLSSSRRVHLLEARVRGRGPIDDAG
ncbi:AI-2E family transporter [Pseudonocardia sp. MH-G8]|uniref:AI-2E family transporter n=1 Tax=Pseudonocardia sp. MH-G8 TaxID=1854588 RepID=UPI000BA09DA7|nr:AI-2E family transporter [Pseudonocardia sp. MH-G8]OZM83546.1 AI-2E family transporter [Pseudonocardia sp. MH-G8]